MTYSETRVNYGGLMRCCLGTLRDYIIAHIDDEAHEGETLDCKYEPPNNRQMILKKGTWRWNNPK
jgi:hypothetical protein